MCIAVNKQIVWQHHDIAELTLHELDDETIERYLRIEEPYESCGAYHYEGLGKWLFKAIKGTEETILGLPLFPLMNALVRLEAVTV
jgi:septum formation protein